MKKTKTPKTNAAGKIVVSERCSAKTARRIFEDIEARLAANNAKRPSAFGCPQCGSTETSFYEGCLGYEAIRCRACGQETDANNHSNHSPMESK